VGLVFAPLRGCIDRGHGFGVGGVVLFGVCGDFGVSLGADFVYRAPVGVGVAVGASYSNST